MQVFIFTSQITKYVENNKFFAKFLKYYQKSC